MSSKKDFEELSRVSYVLANNRESPTTEEINTGCLQRIARSTEAMAINYQKLINSRNWYKEQYEHSKEYNYTLEKRISALKGHLTRLKNKIEADKV